MVLLFKPRSYTFPLSAWVSTTVGLKQQDEQEGENYKKFKQKTKKCFLLLFGKDKKTKLLFYFILYFQVLMTVMFLFGNHVLSTRKEVPRLNVLRPSDLTEIDPLGCYKSKLILEGFV